MKEGAEEGVNVMAEDAGMRYGKSGDPYASLIAGGLKGF